MNGLINRSIQCFLTDTHGAGLWSRVAVAAGLDFENFEPMLDYDPVLTDRVITAAARLLDRPRETVLEDLGTFLVSHPHLGALRRLLRFGGASFVDFLHSLEELPGRGRLALPDLDLPQMLLLDHSPQDYTLTCRAPLAGTGHVLLGLLRAMADDYGALVWLEHQGAGLDGEVIAIRLLDDSFAAARPFALVQEAG